MVGVAANATLTVAVLLTTTGGLCGSAFLDMAFRRNIQLLIGKEQWDSLKDRDKKKMSREFEFGVKLSFTADSTRQYSVDLRGVKDNPAEGILDDTITLKQYVPDFISTVRGD
jgi:hypothetical protein